MKKDSKGWNWEKNGMRLVAVLATAACCWMGLTAGGTVAWAAARPVLRVGVSYISPLHGEDGELPQFDKNVTDYMQVLASYADLDVTFVPGSIGDLIERLDRGEIDVIPNLVKTPERIARMDFSRLPTGFVGSTLYLRGGVARLDENPQAPLRIGFLRGGYQSPGTDIALKDEGVPYERMEFSTLGAIMESYDARELDGYALNMWPDSKQEPASTFDVALAYFAVRKGNAELLARLNHAADQLALTRPTFLSDIYKMHEAEGREVPLLFDREERAYLVAHPQLRVLVVANERPYAYIDEHGQLAGAMKVVADRLATDLGVDIEAVPVADYETAYEGMQDGQVDFLLNMFVDPAWGAERGLDQTAPFLTSYFTAVTRRTGLPAKPVIATLDNRLAKELIAQHFPDQTVRAYPTIEACLEAVRKKQADVTYIRQSAAQYQTMQGGYPDLVTGGHAAFQKGIAMGVPKTGDSVLLRILDKEIHHMGPGVVGAHVLSTARAAARSRDVSRAHRHACRWCRDPLPHASRDTR